MSPINLRFVRHFLALTDLQYDSSAQPNQVSEQMHHPVGLCVSDCPPTFWYWHTSTQISNFQFCLSSADNHFNYNFWLASPSILSNKVLVSDRGDQGRRAAVLRPHPLRRRLLVRRPARPGARPPRRPGPRSAVLPLPRRTRRLCSGAQGTSRVSQITVPIGTGYDNG